MSLGPRLPLSFSPDGGYTGNTTIPQTVKQNLKNLFLTIPGERIMDPAFGVGMKRFLFEPNEHRTHNTIRTKITEQIKKYMSFIDIVEIKISTDPQNENSMFLTFRYIISPLNQQDELQLSVKN